MKYIDSEKLIAEIKIIQKSLEHRDVRFNQIRRTRTECMIEFCKELLRVITSLQQEQPEVDIKKEYDEYVSKDPVYSKLVNGIAGFSIAKHFFELGRAGKED